MSPEGVASLERHHHTRKRKNALVPGSPPLPVRADPAPARVDALMFTAGRRQADYKNFSIGSSPTVT
jgi:hypothetical protein